MALSTKKIKSIAIGLVAAFAVMTSTIMPASALDVNGVSVEVGPNGELLVDGVDTGYNLKKLSEQYGFDLEALFANGTDVDLEKFEEEYDIDIEALIEEAKKELATTKPAPEDSSTPGTEQDSESEAKDGYSLDLDLKAGTTCVITVVNQESVHPKTDVEVTVDGTVHVIRDVEGKAGKISKSEPITIGDSGASAFVRFGPSGISSLESQDVSCNTTEEAPPAKPVPAEPTYTG